MPQPKYSTRPRRVARRRLANAIRACYTRGELRGCGEMADAHDLGSCAARREGSTPSIPTSVFRSRSLSEVAPVTHLPTTLRQVVIAPGEDGWFVAEVPSLPGCISQGRTRAEAIANIREAIALMTELLYSRAHSPRRRSYTFRSRSSYTMSRKRSSLITRSTNS